MKYLFLLIHSWFLVCGLFLAFKGDISFPENTPQAFGLSAMIYGFVVAIHSFKSIYNLSAGGN